MFDVIWTITGAPWQAAQMTMGMLTLFALAALVVGYQIQPTSAHTDQPFRTELFWQHFSQLKDVWREPPVRLCVLGIAYFYRAGRRALT